LLLPLHARSATCLIPLRPSPLFNCQSPARPLGADTIIYAP